MPATATLLRLLPPPCELDLLPPEDAEITVCAVDGGILAYLAGTWQHTDQCVGCATGRPCTTLHTGCDDPEPEMCPHGCRQPVDLDAACSDRGLLHSRSCNGCCWANPHRNGVRT